MNANIISAIINSVNATNEAANKHADYAAQLLSAVLGLEVLSIRDYGVHIYRDDIGFFHDAENVTITPREDRYYCFELSGQKFGINFYTLLNAKDAEEYKQGA